MKCLASVTSCSKLYFLTIVLLTTGVRCLINLSLMLGSKTPVLATHTMRAVVVSKFGDPSVLEIRRDVPIPRPSSQEVLIKVAAVGVNPVDTYIRSGNYGRLPELPYIPGNDMCGTVVSIGAEVNNFKEGDRVASFLNCRSGSYAEYCAVNQDFLVRVPDGYDFQKGAALGVPFFTAYKALYIISAAKPNDTVLIHGASGGVGIACCQLAKSQGMTVFGTAGTKDGMELISSLGVDQAFNHKEDGYTEKIMKATGGHGVNVIVEMLSNVNLNEDLKLLASRGVVAVVGCRGSIEINPRLLMVKESKIRGVNLFKSSPEEFVEMRKAIGAGLHHGWIRPHVGAIYSLNNAAAAHKDIIINAGTKGKMIMTV